MFVRLREEQHAVQTWLKSGCCSDGCGYQGLGSQICDGWGGPLCSKRSLCGHVGVEWSERARDPIS